MSKNQEQMKELINDVRTGKTDKEVLCKEIQKDVNCLIYPVSYTHLTLPTKA